MEKSLDLESFKLLMLKHQETKRKAKKKADEDFYCYMSSRSLQIKKRCGYF
ncbi:MAG: hypothetical protein ACM3X7_09725 [Solirubrobacterales bacterium]